MGFCPHSGGIFRKSVQTFFSTLWRGLVRSQRLAWQRMNAAGNIKGASIKAIIGDHGWWVTYSDKHYGFLKTKRLSSFKKLAPNVTVLDGSLSPPPPSSDIFKAPSIHPSLPMFYNAIKTETDLPLSLPPFGTHLPLSQPNRFPILGMSKHN